MKRILAVTLAMAATAVAACAGGKAESAAVPAPTAASAPVRLTIIRPQAYSRGADYGKVAEYIAGRTGVKIETVFDDGTPRGAVQKFYLMIAAAEDVDSVSMGLNDYNVSVRSGILAPLGEAIDRVGAVLRKKVDPVLFQWLAGNDGKVHGVPCSATRCPATVTIRTDWLKELGLPMPRGLAELEGAMRMMKDRYGTPPMSLHVMIHWPRTFDEALAGWFLPRGYSWWKSADGTYLPPEMHPAYRTFLATLHQWYRDGLIHPETLNANYQQVIIQGKIGVTAGNYSDGFINQDILKTTPNAFYEYVPIVDPQSAGYMAQTMPTSSIAVLNVKSAREKAEAFIKLLSWIAESSENNAVSRNGIRGVHWQFVDEAQYIIRSLQDPRKPAYLPGTFEILDVAGPPERMADANPRLQMYYRYFEEDYAGRVKSYVSLDQKYMVNEASLPSADRINDLRTAAMEAKIRFITGRRPMEEWDLFLSEWRRMGMDAVIAEKGVLYRKLVD